MRDGGYELKTRANRLAAQVLYPALVWLGLLTAMGYYWFSADQVTLDAVQERILNIQQPNVDISSPR